MATREEEDEGGLLACFIAGKMVESTIVAEINRGRGDPP